MPSLFKEEMQNKYIHVFLDYER